MDKNIQKQLKTDYEALEIKPSGHLWEQIEIGLDNQADLRQKPLFQWWKYAAVIVFLISLGSIFYFDSEQFSKPKEIIAVKKQVENNSKPIENFEVTIEPKNTETKSDSNISIKQEKNNSNKEVNKLVINTNLAIPKQVQKITNIEPSITAKPEAETDTQLMKELYDSPQLVTSQPIVKETKVKYVTANDLIFQRKYSIEQKKNAPENVKRLGIIKLNRITVSPELITIFNSSNSTDEQK